MANSLAWNNSKCKQWINEMRLSNLLFMLLLIWPIAPIELTGSLMLCKNCLRSIDEWTLHVTEKFNRTRTHYTFYRLIHMNPIPVRANESEKKVACRRSTYVDSVWMWSPLANPLFNEYIPFVLPLFFRIKLIFSFFLFFPIGNSCFVSILK